MIFGIRRIILIPKYIFNQDTQYCSLSEAEVSKDENAFPSASLGERELNISF